MTPTPFYIGVHYDHHFWYYQFNWGTVQHEFFVNKQYDKLRAKLIRIDNELILDLKAMPEFNADGEIYKVLVMMYNALLEREARRGFSKWKD